MFIFFERWVHIESRSKPPARRSSHKAMITQMVITICCGNIENDSGKKLFKIMIDMIRLTPGGEKLCQFQPDRTSAP